MCSPFSYKCLTAYRRRKLNPLVATLYEASMNDKHLLENKRISVESLADVCPEVSTSTKEATFLNNFIHRETVDVQYELTAMQAIQEQTAIHEKQA